jgi:hypothetical protein
MSIQFTESKIKQAVITISFPISASWHVLNALKTSACEEDNVGYKNAENSVLLYSMYKQIEYKLSASMSDDFKSKFTSSGCDYSFGKFIMSFRVLPTFSAVRKVLGIAAKNMTPTKVNSIYKKFITEIFLSPKSFDWASGNVLSALSKVSVSIVGKIKLDSKKLKTIDDTWKSKRVKEKAKKGAKPDESKRKSDPTEGIVPCTTSFQKFVLKRYLMHNKIDSVVKEKGVLPIIGSMSWAPIKSKLGKASQIKLFSDKQSKLKDKLKDVLTMGAANEGFFAAPELKSIPPTAAKISEALKKVL